MKKTLTVEIRCGKDTCAEKPGVFCQFLGSASFGQKPVCTFPFGKELTTKLSEDEPGGWVQRCKACKKMTQEKSA